MRAKSHDQRKGQWIINKIRFAKDFPQFKPTESDTLTSLVNKEAKIIELRLWNMENNEFDKLMSGYND